LKDEQRNEPEQENLDGEQVAIWKSPIYLGGEVRRYTVKHMPDEWWKQQCAPPNVLILPTHPDMQRSAADELGGADVDGDQVTVCWDRRIVDYIRQDTPAVKMQTKAWYEGDRDDPLVHGGSCLSAEHAGSQQAGPLMAEDEDNGDSMRRITDAKRAFAVHCLVNEEGLGKKAMRQQRWKDLALSLKSTGSDRRDAIKAAEKKAEFLADLLHWQADAAKQGRSTKPLVHWDDKQPFLNNRGFDGPMRGNELRFPHYEEGSIKSHSAVGRLHDRLQEFVSETLPTLLGDMAAIELDNELLHSKLSKVEGITAIDDIQTRFQRISAEIREEKQSQEGVGERLISSKTADDGGSSDAISAVLSDEIARFNALHIDEQLLQASCYYKVHVEDYNRKVKRFNAEAKAAVVAEQRAIAGAGSAAAAAAAAVPVSQRRPTLSNWPRQVCEKAWNILKAQARRKRGESLLDLLVPVAVGRESWVRTKPPTRSVLEI